MQESINEILHRAISGDHKAFRRVVEACQQQAFSLAFRILGNEEEAKDAVQEGFIKVWQHIGSYETSSPFHSWINCIMANTAIDHLRANRRQFAMRMSLDTERLISIFQGRPDVVLENKEIASLIGMLADGLPDKQRLVFILRDIQGLESDEVQEIMRLSDTRVKSNLYHARKFVREKIKRILSFERRSS